MANLALDNSLLVWAEVDSLCKSKFYDKLSLKAFDHQLRQANMTTFVIS